MAQVLYRKYRSKDFSELIGQDNVIKIIKQAIKDDSVAHAYLFNGPRGTGKTSLARILAKALNCQNLKKGEPCNKCTNCVAINNASFMDLIEIDAASNRGIDEIRELKEKLAFMPVEGSTKVYIIDEVHMLTTEAFNALLKTLEEPPERVVFVLATTEVHKLPQTIISRTQRFDFKLASDDELAKKLKYILKGENINIEDDALDLIIQAGSGSFRDAETILEKTIVSTSHNKITLDDVTKVLGFASQKVIEQFFLNLSEGNAKEAIGLVEEAEGEGVDITQMVKQVLLKARKELIKSIQAAAGSFNLKFLYVLIKEMNEASDKIRYSPVPSLPVELAILNIVGISSVGDRSSDKEMQKKVANSFKAKNKKSSSETVKNEDKSKVKPNNKKSMRKSREVSLDTKNESSQNLDLEEITSRWDEVLKIAKDNNSQLAAMLIRAEIDGIDADGKVVLNVPFKFHRKQLENKNTMLALGNITLEVYGNPLNFRYEVDEKLAAVEDEKKDEESNIGIVEEIFGDFA